MKSSIKAGIAITFLGFALFTISPANGNYQNQIQAKYLKTHDTQFVAP